MPGPHVTVRKKSIRPLEQAPQAGSMISSVRSIRPPVSEPPYPVPSQSHREGPWVSRLGSKGLCRRRTLGFPEQGSELQPSNSCRFPGFLLGGWQPGPGRPALPPVWSGSQRSHFLLQLVFPPSGQSTHSGSGAPPLESAALFRDHVPQRRPPPPSHQAGLDTVSSHSTELVLRHLCGL